MSVHDDVKYINKRLIALSDREIINGILLGFDFYNKRSLSIMRSYAKPSEKYTCIIYPSKNDIISWDYINIFEFNNWCVKNNKQHILDSINNMRAFL